MTVGPITAIARQDLRILRTDFVPVTLLIILPLLLMPFLRPAFKLALTLEGVQGATGAEQVVPGMAVTFGFFLVSNVSLGFYREHGWNTWDRLRVSTGSAADIVVGKMVVPLLQAVAQFVVLFVLGGAWMGLHVRGSWLALCAVGAAFGFYLVTTGLAVTALCRTSMQATAVANIGALLLAGLAGALVPYKLLPAWAHYISPAVPSYWAMEGYRHAILGGSGNVTTPIVVLLGFSGVSAFIAAIRLRLGDSKAGFA
ncbi:MAG TPA: ABC transporter permease [Solirubrobacteraceae bacterium]|nr:ABC transporter permease [Solirubrobacteraceae bacterium]